MIIMILNEYVLIALIVIAISIVFAVAVSSVDVDSSIDVDMDHQKIFGDFGIDSDNMFLFAWSLTGGDEYGRLSGGFPPLYSLMD